MTELDLERIIRKSDNLVRAAKNRKGNSEKLYELCGIKFRVRWVKLPTYSGYWEIKYNPRHAPGCKAKDSYASVPTGEMFLSIDIPGVGLRAIEPKTGEGLRMALMNIIAKGIHDC
jgi:hypothetical protein